MKVKISLKKVASVILLATLPVFVLSISSATPTTVTSLGHNVEAKFANVQHLPYANPNAPKGGTLSLSAMGTFNSVNVWIDVGNPVVGTNYLYETLMTGSLSEAFVMYPQLAEKVTFDENDASWIIYHLNPHAKFWDGSPVTADDVKASMDALLTKGVMSMRSYLSDVKEVQVIDKLTVKFIFKSAENKEIGLTVGQMPIWSKKSIDESFEKVTLTPLMGSGAYKIANIEAGRSITYERDPNYWGIKPEAKVMANVGRFNFDKIKYVYYQSDEVAFEGFKAGQYQFRPESKARNWATAYNFPAVKAGMVVKEEIANKNPVPMQGLVMNLRRPLFQDIRVRQALTYAYDFEWLNKTMFYQQYDRLQSYFYHSELEATGKISEQELAILQPWLNELEPVQREQTLAEWQAPKSNGDGFNRENLLKARQLLLNAGFSYQNMKLYQPNGEPAKLEILVADERMNRTLLPYVRNLKRLGFDANIRQVDRPQYLERSRKFDYDMVINVFAQSLSPGAEQLSLWGSQSADEQGNQNSVGIKNPVIDKIIDKLIKAKNRDEIILYTKILDRLLRAGYYIVPMYGKRADNVAYWQHYAHGQLPTNAIGIDYWWVDKDKEQAVKRYLGE